MRSLSITLLAALAVILPATSGQAGESDAPQVAQERTVVLFGARWCLPCRVELQQLPTLAAAVAPDRLQLAWIDRPLSPSLTAYGPNVSILAPAEARRLFASVNGSNQALPLAAIYDRDGKLCALLRAPLYAEKVAAFKARCK